MTDISRRTLLKSALATYAAYSVPGNAAITSSPTVAQAGAENLTGTNQAMRLDEGWRFHLGNGDLPGKDFDFGRMSREGTYAKNGRLLPVAEASFNDTAWASVNLPHDWAVELPFVDGPYLPDHGAKPLGREYPDTSIGWYRRAFSVAPEDAGQKFFLRFDGVFRQALVLLNGMYLGETWSGYAPYTFELSDMLNFDAPNILVVRVDASLGEGWFYEGAGIYRHVWLTKKPPVHLVEDSTIVRSKMDRNAAQLTLLCEVMNQSSVDQLCQMSVSVQAQGDHPKAEIQAHSISSKVAAGESIILSATARLSDPMLWSPDSPALYQAAFTLQADATTIDHETVSFGIRTFRFDPNQGFFVNGIPTKIKGTCNHHDHAGVGVAVPDRLHEYRLERLKEMGSNAVRTSHNPPSKEFLEACDYLGMLAMVETRMMSSSAQGMDQLSRMVRRFRNHPSVFLWSLGNEEREQGTLHGERMVASMRQMVARLDPTRPVTVAMNGQWGKGVSNSVDVQGCNYFMNNIDAFHRDHPTFPMIGSETASALSTRGEYSNDKLQGYMSAYDTNAPSWGATAETWWKFYEARPFLGGGFAWTGFDYRGEPTPYGFPCISSHFGILDTCGFPKDSYYYYKAWWSAEPVLHLYPHWDWPGRSGEPIDVWVQTNLDEVELFLNGNSQGVKKVERLGHVQWSVPYAHGNIEARGTKSGKVILTERRETTSKPTQLRLTADRTTVRADGRDLAVLSLEVLDEKSRLVPIAKNLIQFEISGEGAILGVGNGDPSCHEPDKALQRSAFNGLCMVLVQSTGTRGTIHITARSPDLKEARLELTAA